MLACTRRYDARQNHRPWLVWLHGLLGSQLDWTPVLPFMHDWPCLTVDLPGHGESVEVRANSFAETNQLLAQTLARQNIDCYILIGYSLGGRIALYHACQRVSNGLTALAVEGANLGLRSEGEKQRRIEQDGQWAERFRSRPMHDVLAAWYRQPVFADLSDGQRERLIDYREDNNGTSVADMLEATSLGRQPWLGDCLRQRREIDKLPFCYLCGENDAKFQQLAKDYRLPLKTVAQAGHNAHRSNPEGFAQQLISFLKEC